jgi:hypothetical protein
MRTSIVHGVYPAIVQEEGERVSADADGDATGGAHVVQQGRSHEAL